MYAGTSTLGNHTTDNTLTLDGINLGGGTPYYYGGYTQSVTGNSTGNTVIVKNAATTSGDNYIYGGWSEQGKATGNTVILAGNNYSGAGYDGMLQFSYVLGGGSNLSGADVRTGNTLQVRGIKNGAYSINNFEKMQFALDGSVSSGDTMLNVWAAALGYQTFDLSNISVDKAAEWMAGAHGTKRVTLYKGPALSLNNYDVSGTTSGDFEYGIRSNTATPTATTVTDATELYFEGNKFQNSHVTYNNETAQADDEKNGIYHTLPSATGVYSGAIYAGTSTLGNTTTKNVLTVDGLSIRGRLYGGYTQSVAGDSTGNTVIVKNAASTTSSSWIYGGWSKQGKATGNTVVLAGNNHPGGYSGMWRNTDVYGGYSDNTAADVRTGNTLQVRGIKNGAYSINNFEKMQFALDGSVSSGDTMLNVATGAQTFD